jgi:DNA-binding SARP family transcriptional activator/class 3 adenylate cyclase/tetratricopeptide (TPR) repeat protein
MAKVNLALLGGLRLQTDSGEPVPLSTRKAGALLAYLALHPGQAQARPKLAALLWGDRSEVQARDSLRQALSLLRKALSHVDPRALIAYEDTIRFAPTALTTDAVVFGDVVAQPGVANLEQAIGLYAGELLEGFQVRAPEFESWATAERERFRELALEAMTRLLDHHLSIGAVEGGIRIAARLLAADPLQERVHRTLMELYCRQGRNGAALRQYRTCADLLAKELGIEPDATTKALRREILREWNQRQGTTSCPDAAANPLGDIEIEPPATPRAPERRQITVLVCDLAGASSLAARLDPEELQALIAAYQRCCTPIISRSGGAVGKFSGTEMLAYFGHPQANEHDVERAVRVGLALVEAVSRLDCGTAGPLQLRVGVATGPVVVGDLLGTGVDRQVIVGEAAQLAGGLERTAEPNTVAIGASTRQLVGTLFDCADLGQVAVNGFPEPVPAWRVLGPSGIDSRFEALRAPTTPLIGREEELELLLRRWRQASSGDGRVVLLAGEPGIGKSRLPVELQQRLQAESHTRLRQFCSPHHQDSALYPVISQLQRAAGFRRDNTDQQRLDRLEAVLAQTSKDLKGVAPLIADLLSVPTGDRYPPLNLTPQKRKEKTLQALRAQLEGMAAREPVLVVFEDVHWIDPTSLELLDLIVERVPALPVLLIITFRPEFAAPWIGRPQVTLLTLNRLPPSERAAMIAAVAGGKALPQEMVDQIIDRTDGVPLFIEELTKTVVESGIFAEAGGRHALMEPAALLSIPSTLQASLLARLDRLPATREVVQTGAALGRSFSHELISAVAQMPQQQVDDALVQLVSAELIFRRGVAPDAEYTFKHALVQDVARGTLLRNRREQIHARIVATLETQFPEIVSAQPQVVAQHCAEANFDEKAVGYWLKAGQQAVARSAMMEAVAQLQNGLNLLANLPQDPQRQRQELDLRIALGQAQMATKGLGAAEVGETFGRARVLAEQLARPDELIAVLNGQWIFHLMRAEHGLALSLAQQTEQIAETSPAARFLGPYNQGVSRFLLGEFVTAHALFERCLLNVPEDSVWPAAPAAVTHVYLAQSLACLGYIDQAQVQTNQALAEAYRLQHAHALAHVLTLACYAEWFAGWPHDAHRHAEEVAALASEHGFPLFSSWGMIHRGWSLAALGQPQDGIAPLTEGISAYRAMGGVSRRPQALMMLAEAYTKLGRRIEGLNCLTEAAQIIETTDERYDESELYRLRGDLLNDTGDQPAAEQNYRVSLAVAARQSAKTSELRAATSLASLWRDQGKREQARNLLAPVYNWFTEGLDTPVLKEARAVLEQLAG